MPALDAFAAAYRNLTIPALSEPLDDEEETLPWATLPEVVIEVVYELDEAPPTRRDPAPPATVRGCSLAASRYFALCA